MQRYNFILKLLPGVLISLVLMFSKTGYCSDTLQTKSKVKKVLGRSVGPVLYVTSFTGLYAMWYCDYETSRFHLFDDSGEWLQVDKCGHSYTSYWLTRHNYSIYRWTGMSKNQSLLIGSVSSILYMSTIELFDGFSKKWGASVYDIGANTLGSLLFVSQQALWNEQKIVYKYSFMPSKYARLRPNELGRNLPEQLVKDYNALTFWLSFNVSSLTGTKALPNWLCVSFGYGANELLSGFPLDSGISPKYSRYRQYYLSLDVDFQKIKTKSKVLRNMFSLINMVKLPFPSFEFSEGRPRFAIP